MINYNKAPNFLLIVGVFLFLTVVPPVQAEWIKHSFDVMGTRAIVELESPSNEESKMIVDQVVSEMHRIDQLMSPYKKNSELSKVNRLASTEKVVISKEFFDLLVESNRISNLTEGAFDISFSSVGYLFNYRDSIKPSKREIKNLQKSINYRSILFDHQSKSVKFNNPKLKIDLGGIAKGYAVDQCIKLLLNAGVKNAYISAGGDSRIIGKKRDRLWYIGIKHPRNKNKLLANLPLEEVSISTSGDYERFFIEDGIRFHHIIDPKTGDSARSLQSVTILAPNSTLADALSTSVFILGTEKGLALINRMPNVSVIIVDAKGQLFFSDDMAQVD